MNEKQQAVLKTYIFWAWREQNPFRSKRAYPNYVNRNLEYCICPVCKYDSDCTKVKWCVNCPMHGRWPSAVGGELLSRCNVQESAYIWYRQAKERGDAKRASLYAGNVAAALWKLYKELEDK